MPEPIGWKSLNIAHFALLRNILFQSKVPVFIFYIKSFRKTRQKDKEKDSDMLVIITPIPNKHWNTF